MVLTRAAEKGHANCVRLLIDAGANMETKNSVVRGRWRLFPFLGALHFTFHSSAYSLSLDDFL